MSVVTKIVPLVLIGLVASLFMFGESTKSNSSTSTARVHVADIVMMNSDFANGRGPSYAPCLVLFDLDQPGPVSGGKLKAMRRISEKIYDLYASDETTHSDPEMSDFIKHVQDDTYRAHRRKAVPSYLAKGRRLYVSDAMLSRGYFSPSRAMRKVTMVKVTGDSRGTVQQVPWDDTMVPYTAN